MFKKVLLVIMILFICTVPAHAFITAVTPNGYIVTVMETGENSATVYLGNLMALYPDPGLEIIHNNGYIESVRGFTYDGETLGEFTERDILAGRFARSDHFGIMGELGKITIIDYSAGAIYRMWWNAWGETKAILQLEVQDGFTGVSWRLTDSEGGVFE